MSRDFIWPEVDAADREKACCDLSTCYLVEAAAGTGKTTLLVARIVHIVETTLTRLPRIVAITFTEKAAGELKSKLKDALEKQARGEGEAAEHCRVALQDLDSMPVGTIHSFCRELLAERPVEAGVEPGFSVLDETASLSANSDFFEQWISEELRGECPAAAPMLRWGMALDGDAADASLRTLFHELRRHRDDLDSLAVPHRSHQQLLELAQALRDDIHAAAALCAACRDPEDKLVREISRAWRWSEALKTDSLPLLFHATQRLPKLKSNVGQKTSWNPLEALLRMREFCDDLPARVSELQREIFSRYAASLIEWLRGGVERGETMRRERAQLDFDDLLIFARNMLRSSQSARDYFRQRFDYVLVDEFQDTDPLQTEVVFFLSERDGRFASSWEDVELDTGKLFIVGDPKQSIYRFRRADLDLYGRVREKLARDGGVLTIRANFRSEGALISEVNSLFREVMRGHGERCEPDYVAMEPYRPSMNEGPHVVVLPPPENLRSKEANSDILALAEAAAIAEHIREILAAQDSLSYRDVAVLYPTTTRLLELETALRSRGIPFETSGGRNLPQRAEVQALRVVLAAVDNPHDGLSVVGALRSPFFGCSDEELLRHRLDGGSFDFTAAASHEEHVARCFALLRDLHDQRRRRLPSDTLSRIFETTAGLHVFALKPHGENRVANLLKILDMARALECGGSCSLHRLVRELMRLEELRLGEDDSILDDDSDAVRLMTFHKAKGLEFPVVILYHLRRDYGRKLPSVVVDRRSKTVEFRAAHSQTSRFDAALGDELDRQKHESWRQLYVAMTRARDTLVLPLGWISARSKGRNRWLHDVLASRYPTRFAEDSSATNGEFIVEDLRRFDLSVTPQENLLLEPEPRDADATRRERKRWRAELDMRVAGLDHSSLFRTPSASKAFDSARSERRDAPSAISAPQFGLFVHRLLQHVSLPDGGNLETVAALAQSEYSVSDDMCRAGVEFVRRALQSDLFTLRVARAEQLFRELPFTLHRNGIIMEGAMDLVFRENNGWVIVDFKTDSVSSGECAARAAVYREQASDYAAALTEITRERVNEVILYFLRPGVRVSIISS